MVRVDKNPKVWQGKFWERVQLCGFIPVSWKETKRYHMFMITHNDKLVYRQLIILIEHTMLK